MLPWKKSAQPIAAWPNGVILMSAGNRAVQKAYNALADPARRREYDAQRRDATSRRSDSAKLGTQFNQRRLLHAG